MRAGDESGRGRGELINNQLSYPGPLYYVKKVPSFPSTWLYPIACLDCDSYSVYFSHPSPCPYLFWWINSSHMLTHPIAPAPLFITWQCRIEFNKISVNMSCQF